MAHDGFMDLQVAFHLHGQDWTWRQGACFDTLGRLFLMDGFWALFQIDANDLLSKLTKVHCFA